MTARRVFEGHIAGIGTSSGLRAVVGLWRDSPFGPFSDAMVELPSGHRILLAPAAEIGRFITGIYTFDETQVLPLAASRGADQFTLDAGPLQIRARLGARTGLGAAVRLIPRPLAVHPRWLRAVNPLAARLGPGMRTAGTARGGWREYYGVMDLHRIVSATVHRDGGDAGTLAAIRPAVRFGFSSVPPDPVLIRVRTTVEPAPAAGG